MKNRTERNALTDPSGSRFRLLTDGDVLQKGDELLMDDADTWEPIGKDDSLGECWMVGSKYRSQVFMPARRKILSEKKEPSKQ